MSQSIESVFCRAIAWLLLASNAGAQPIRQDSLEDWVWGHRPEIVEACLPVRPLELADFPDDLKWLLMIRIEVDDIEWYARIQEKRQGQLTLRFVTLENSLTDKIRQLKERNPMLQPPEIAKLISQEMIHHRELNSQSCPALIGLADGLRNMKASPLLTGALMVDATKYELTSQWHYNWLQVTYFGPGSDAPKQPHPIIEWIEALRNQVKDCGP